MPSQISEMPNKTQILRPFLSSQLRMWADKNLLRSIKSEYQVRTVNASQEFIGSQKDVYLKISPIVFSW